MEPERFIGTNRHKKGHLIGASTPDGDKYMLAHIKPKAKGWFHLAYPAVAKAAAMLKKGSKSQFVESKVDLIQETETEKIYGAFAEQTIGSYQAVSTQKPIDPYLKAEIEGFLQWIKNPQGLPGYISNALQQNDQNRISKLAEIYMEFYNLFYP